MSKLSYVITLFILVYFFGLSYSNAKLSTINISQNPSQLSVVGDCKVSFDSKTSQLKLVSKIAVGPQMKRARCIVRFTTPNTQKQFRLVPLAVKGEVKKASTSVAISSILIGDKPTSLSKKYTTPTNFDLTNQIPKTNYTTQGKNVFGINLVLASTGGELEMTDMTFALQQK